MRLRTVLLLLCLSVLFASPAAAQEGRNELVVFGGISLVDVDFSEVEDPFGPILVTFAPAPNRRLADLDGSAEFGARYGRAVTDRITVEADFSVAPSHQLDERIIFGCPPPLVCIASPDISLFVPDIQRTRSFVAYHYGGGVRLALTDGPIRPSVVGGLGAVTYAASGATPVFGHLASVTDIGSDLRETRLAIRLGGAVAATLGSLVTHLEVVDVIVADHFVTGRAEHDVHVRVGIGVRW